MLKGCRFTYQLTTKTKKMNYELKVTETNKKAAKFHYQVIDENGNVICERKSNNEYVYCTINGAFYSGKLGNIEKSTQYKYDLESASDKSKLTTFAYKK
jgi:hypothetical protein